MVEPIGRSFSEGELRALLDLVEASDLVDLRVELDGSKIALHRDAVPAAREERASPDVLDGVSSGGRSEGGQLVTSPWVGVFHPSVSPGSTIAPGQSVGVVEALRMPHEVVSDVGGLVEDVLVEDGHVVEYGQPLARIMAVQA